METVNERVKKVRHALKLSQVEFSKGILISNGYLASIELGNRKVNSRIIKLISTTYEVNEKWLKTGKEGMFSDDFDEKLNRVVNLFKELKPKYKDYILKQIDQLLELQNS